MSNRGIAIYHEGKLVETVSVLSEFEIGEDLAVFVYDGGEISRTQLYSGGVLTVEGGDGQ